MFLFTSMHISLVLFSPGSAKTDVLWSKYLNSYLMPSCVKIICAKNY